MVLLIDPWFDLCQDIDTCTSGAWTMGKVVVVDSSTESRIARKRK